MTTSAGTRKRRPPLPSYLGRLILVVPVPGSLMYDRILKARAVLNDQTRTDAEHRLALRVLVEFGAEAPVEADALLERCRNEARS
jgi:hypothetical protein